MATTEVTLIEPNVMEVKNYMAVMDDTGDSRIQWDPTNQAEVAKAETKFNELKAKGFMSYRVNKKGDKGVVLDKFDPAAERIILHSQMVGG